MSLSFCDCCGAPMCNYSHHRADSCSAGETDACLLCGMFPPSADELLEEICALGEHINDPRVQARIILLSDAARDAARDAAPDAAPDAARKDFNDLVNECFFGDTE